MCLRFADMERKLGEIDRARAVYSYCSQMCDPRVSKSSLFLLNVDFELCCFTWFSMQQCNFVWFIMSHHVLIEQLCSVCHVFIEQLKPSKRVSGIIWVYHFMPLLKSNNVYIFTQKANVSFNLCEIIYGEIAIHGNKILRFLHYEWSSGADPIKPQSLYAIRLLI